MHEVPRPGLVDRNATLLASVLGWGLGGLLALGFVSLVLAMTNLMSPWLALALSAVAAPVIVRHMPTGLSGPVGFPVLAFLGLVVLGFAAFGVLVPHEHILGGRDPGTYVGTATWIAREGGLWMDVGDQVFSGVPVVYETLGFPAVGSPELLRPQFLHLFPSLLALVAGTAGPQWMYLVTPMIGAIGLLALFAFSRSLTSEWSSLAVTVIFALSLPFFFFYRAPFTEPLTFTLLFGGLWVLQRALADKSKKLALAAGLLFGAVLAARIDGALVLLGLTTYVVYLQWIEEGSDSRGGDPQQAHLAETTWRVAIAVLILAVIDGAVYSPAYLSDHGLLLGSVLALTLAIKVFGQRLGPWFLRRRQRAGIVAGALIGGLLAYSGLIRPHVAAPTRDDIYGIAGLQEAAGAAVEPLRSYSELSVHWLTWYLGIPLILIGFVAVVLFTQRLISGHGADSALFIFITSITTLVYVLRPSINPDQIWAMRRFLPVVVPGLILLAAMFWEEFSKHFGRWRRVATALAIAVAALTVLPPTVAVGVVAELEGGAHDMELACQKLGDEPVVIFLGESAPSLSQALAPVLRGWCGAAVAIESESGSLDEEDLNLLYQRTAESNRALWLIGSDKSPAQSRVLLSGSYEYLELTLFRPPENWLPLAFSIEGERS